MENMRVVFTGGGTGGHVYPNIAIYEAIKEKYPQSSVLYIGTKQGAESRIVKNISQPIDFISVLSKGIPMRIKSFKTLIALLYIFLGAIKSYFVLKKFKPDIIIGSGGYVAAPVLIAASILKLKVFVHEQNAVPGRLNRFIARFANRIGVSFASTADFFPRDKVTVTGYPLRKSIVFQSDENIKKKYGIPEKNKVVFVFGGSGGAKTINNAVAEMVPGLLAVDGLTVILSTGRGYSKEYRAYEDTINILKQIGVPSEIDGKLIIREYFDNIDEIYSISDLIISRAGAGTIKEITTLGIPSILIPKINLPGDHQILNAREVEKIGGARIVYEEVLYQDNKRTIYIPENKLLSMIKDVLFDSELLFSMKKNLKEIERQNSGELILEDIEQIIRGKVTTEDKQIKVYYLQSQVTEKSIELIFDNTTVGNSFLADAYVEDAGEPTLLEIKKFDAKSKIMVRRIRGQVLLNKNNIDKLVEMKEGDEINIGKDTFTLKSYMEKVQKVGLEKSTSSNIIGSSLGIITSRLGGFLREVIIAAYFGASRAMDIFAVGLSVSNIMRRVVAENALENAFLPVFLRLFHRSSRKKTWEAASSIVNFTVLLSIIFTLLGILFAPLIVQTFFPSLAQKETVSMVQLMIPYLFLVTLAAVMATYLKAFNRFGIAEASAIFFSIGTVMGVIIFHSKWGMYSLAVGVLMGGGLQILILLPFITKIFKTPSLEFSYRPIIKFSSPPQ